LNNPHLHDTNDGHDPIAGQTFGTPGDRTRIFSLPVPAPDGSSQRIAIRVPGEWVVPTGGGYFLAPAVSTVKTLAG
jgi:hypothetical protein